MKARIIGAALLVVVLAVAAATSATGATKRSTASITVWLQVDAQSGWPAVVAAANAAFAKQHPGVDVKVQYQTWGTHLGKFDATLAGGNTPDVIEMGNTEMTKYMAAGAFQDITSAKASFDNSSTWLEGLAASGRYNGKLYGVPYYAGSRVVTYRSDQYKQAGIKSTPKSLAEFTADAGKLNKKFGKAGLLARLHRRHRLVRRDGLRLRLRRQDRHAGERQVEGHARLAEVDRRPDRVQELLPRGLEGQQDDRREPADPVQRVRGRQRGLDRRPRLVLVLRR